MAPHPPFKPSSIAPLPLPSPFTQFSYQPNMFDPTKELPKSYVTLSDHFTGRFSDCNDSYDRPMNYGPKVQKTAQNYANYSTWNTLEGRFEAETLMADDESGISSPPLWKSSPQHENNVNYRCLSPSSRAQAIARGQKELMEMVSKMPESCYELSLKDLVERQPVVVVEPKQESFAEGRGSNSIDERKYKNEKQNSQKQQLSRSGSLADNGGFLLKMVFPVSLGSKKKKKLKKNKSKKNDSNTNSNSKVSPKPTVADASGKAVDKDWWKKRSGSSESDSSGSTIKSGSTKSIRSSSRGSGRSYRSISTTSRRHRRSGCLAFIFPKKTKALRSKEGSPQS